MILGILKEPDFDNRVAILPEVVAKIVKMNVTVLTEKDAGARAFAYDEDYKEAGAEIASADEIIQKADVVIKINSPENDLVGKLRDKQIFFALMSPLTNKSLVDQMLSKGVTSFSFDMIPRTTRGQAMDILSSMATIAGYKAVLTAANNLAKFFPMFMSAAGTIKPAKILILGAGVAGLQAIATSRKLGGVVEVFDVRAAVKEEVQSLGGKFIEVEGAKDDASAGGYAVEQTEEFKRKQQEMIQEHAKKANAIICTAQIPGRKAPVLVKKETVESMLPGSVIVDLAASTGGNCELTEDSKTVIHNGVKIIGNSYFPSEMPSDSSRMFGNNVFNLLKLMIDKEGNINLDFEDDIIKGTCVTHEKQVVNERVKEFLSK